MKEIIERKLSREIIWKIRIGLDRVWVVEVHPHGLLRVRYYNFLVAGGESEEAMQLEQYTL